MGVGRRRGVIGVPIVKRKLKAEELVLRPVEDGAGEAVSPVSRELVIGLIGFVGAGCSAAANRLEMDLQLRQYEVHKIKLSKLIQDAAKVPPSADKDWHSRRRGQA